MNKCSIVMYHYVRDLKNSRYPEIKGLDTGLFRQQLQWLQQTHTLISVPDLIEALYEGRELPKNAALLTFDDAYSDHYTNVFPLLDEYGIQGAFFPPVKAIMEHEVLDVNKIHFILASTKIEELLPRVYDELAKYRQEYGLEGDEYYYQKLAKPSRFDPPEVIFVKRLLQVELGEEVRNKIVDNLFSMFVSQDEAAFSRELYMNEEQMRCMVRHGMTIGSHGYDHYWQDSLSPKKQEQEIDKSIEFLKRIGVDMENWVMCYPYGAWNDSLVSILKKKNCKLAFTTEVAQANVIRANAFCLPRLDCNDFPPKSERYREIEQH